MIDLHCHILPGVDDGAKTIEESVAMARAAAVAGTKVIVATPHMRHPQFHVPGSLAATKLAEVRAALEAARVPVEVVPGGEIHWSAGIADGLRSGELLGIGAAHRWILFELPYSHVPPSFREIAWQLQLSGTQIVLAHPERIVEFQDHPGKIEDWRNAGILVQVTAQSLTGEFGKRPQKTAERWLAAGHIDLVASDGHNTLKRPPTLDGAARAIRRAGGDTLAQRLLHEVPRRIVAGEALI
ncbi:MAG: Tyrosine-protein phosphatase YwqE [Planctomycetes bacterium]|nr:Tyrosine-protein phosphatase YwqE [Planctomycetota bacterium]